MADDPTTQQLVEELGKAKVSDLLVHASSMIASLGFAKLDPGTRDLGQAQLAIEALKALGPLLPGDSRRDVDGVVAALQLAYADAVKTAS